MCTSFRSIKAAFACFALLAWAAMAHGVEMMDGRLQVHGFLTQGIVVTSDNNFMGGSDDDGSLDLREIGLNFSLRATPDLHFSGQLLSHRSGEMDDGGVQLDYGMVDWTLLSGEQGRGGLRLGRVKLPYGFYNETRDVAYTRPAAVLPQPIYFEMTRNLQMSADGISIYGEFYGEAGNLYASYQLGYPQADDRSVEAAFLGRNMGGHFEANLSHLVNVTYEGDGGRYKLGMTYGWVGMDYQRGTADPVTSGSVKFRPVIVSAQYNAEKWSLTAEHFYEFFQFDEFGPLLDSSPVARSYYLQGAYRPAPKWEIFARYDAFFRDQDDSNGKDWHARTGLPDFMAYAKDWSAGVRYDVNENFMVRAELHRVNGTGWLSSLENPDPLGLEQHWNMFMLLGSFRF